MSGARRILALLLALYLGLSSASVILPNRNDVRGQPGPMPSRNDVPLAQPGPDDDYDEFDNSVWDDPEWDDVPLAQPGPDDDYEEFDNSVWDDPEWDDPEWDDPEWDDPEWDDPEWDNPEWDDSEWDDPEQVHGCVVNGTTWELGSQWTEDILDRYGNGDWLGVSNCTCMVGGGYQCSLVMPETVHGCVDRYGITREEGEQWKENRLDSNGDWLGVSSCTCIGDGDYTCSLPGCVDRDGTTWEEGSQWMENRLVGLSNCTCSDGFHDCIKVMPEPVPGCVDKDRITREEGEQWTDDHLDAKGNFLSVITCTCHGGGGIGCERVADVTPMPTGSGMTYYPSMGVDPGRLAQRIPTEHNYCKYTVGSAVKYGTYNKDCNKCENCHGKCHTGSFNHKTCKCKTTSPVCKP